MRTAFILLCFFRPHDLARKSATFRYADLRFAIML